MLTTIILSVLCLLAFGLTFFVWQSGQAAQKSLTETSFALSQARTEAEGARNRVGELQDEKIALEDRTQDLQTALSETSRQLAEVKSEAQGQKARLLELHEERQDLSARLEATREALSELQAQNARDRATASERIRALEEVTAKMNEQFKATSTEALQTSMQQLLKRAEETFAEREKLNSEKLNLTLKPVTEQLQKFEEKVTLIEKARAEDTGGLKEQIAALASATKLTQDVTGKLANALRRGAGVQGRWGEESLRNVLTTAGLTQFDFTEQTSTDTEEGRRRPDVTVKLPGGGVFIIDAKVSLTAYLEAIEAVDEEARNAALIRHAASIANHVKGLSDKAYWDQFKDVGTPDFVALFVPGDGFLAAALERNSELMGQAMDKRVLIVTPTTLFALCKAVAYGWRVEDQAKNARDIAELGRELYKRLSVMGSHTAKVGRSLGDAVDHYNRFVGSLESQVLTQAKKFETLKVDHQGKEIPELSQIEAAPRRLSKLEAE